MDIFFLFFFCGFREHTQPAGSVRSSWVFAKFHALFSIARKESNVNDKGSRSRLFSLESLVIVKLLRPWL